MSKVEELEKVPVATNWIEPNTQTLFKWTGTNYQVDTTKDCGNNILLENKYFEYSIVFTKQSAVENKKTYTFKNCKFRNVRTEFFSSENVIFKLKIVLLLVLQVQMQSLTNAILVEQRVME